MAKTCCSIFAVVFLFGQTLSPDNYLHSKVLPSCHVASGTNEVVAGVCLCGGTCWGTCCRCSLLEKLLLAALFLSSQTIKQAQCSKAYKCHAPFTPPCTPLCWPWLPFMCMSWQDMLELPLYALKFIAETSNASSCSPTQLLAPPDSLLLFLSISPSLFLSVSLGCLWQDACWLSWAGCAKLQLMV